MTARIGRKTEEGEETKRMNEYCKQKERGISKRPWKLWKENERNSYYMHTCIRIKHKSYSMLFELWIFILWILFKLNSWTLNNINSIFLATNYYPVFAIAEYFLLSLLAPLSLKIFSTSSLSLEFRTTPVLKGQFWRVAIGAQKVAIVRIFENGR